MMIAVRTITTHADNITIIIIIIITTTIEPNGC